MTRYFVDTEFIEDGKTIDLISIAIVADDGRTFYAENMDCDLTRASDWVKENVLPHLSGSDWWMTKVAIAAGVKAFCDPELYGKPEFWGYYADYDWVAICQLFGRMIDLPKGWPKYMMDIKQLAMSLGDPRLPFQQSGEHHALNDAQHNRVMYKFLQDVLAERTF